MYFGFHPHRRPVDEVIEQDVLLVVWLPVPARYRPGG